ncbi:hypothetical protein [Arthrobacter sp. TMS1-12-1]
MARIKQFLGPSHSVKQFSGEQAVQKYVNETCGDVFTWGVERREDGYYCPRLLVNRVEHEDGGRFLGKRFDSPDSLISELDTYVDTNCPGLLDRSLQDWTDGTIYHLPRSAITLIDL